MIPKCSLVEEKLSLEEIFRWVEGELQVQSRSDILGKAYGNTTHQQQAPPPLKPQKRSTYEVGAEEKKTRINSPPPSPKPTSRPPSSRGNSPLFPSGGRGS